MYAVLQHGCVKNSKVVSLHAVFMYALLSVCMQELGIPRIDPAILELGEAMQPGLRMYDGDGFLIPEPPALVRERHAARQQLQLRAQLEVQHAFPDLEEGHGHAGIAPLDLMYAQPHQGDSDREAET